MGSLNRPSPRLVFGTVAADEKEIRKIVTVKRVDSMMPDVMRDSKPERTV
jgi:hypothetical protein